MHVARLVAITELKNVPAEIRPFVEFKAEVEERKLEQNDLVGILNIDSTACYVPVFMKDPVSMQELEKELESQDAKLTAESKTALAPHMRK